MYRHPVLALEARLAALREHRAALDVEIDAAQRVLDAWRTPAPRRWSAWWVAPLATAIWTLGVAAVVFFLVDPLCWWSFCCGGTEGSIRARAATVRSAAMLYLAQSRDGDCPTVEVLRAEGYMQDGSDFTDGRGHDFWIECRGSDVLVRSCSFDGENVIDRP